MSLYKGKLIAFEGIDGSGKTTAYGLLKEYLKVRDYPILFLREPSKEGRYGKELALLIAEGKRKSPREEYELFQKARKENVEAKIIPALDEGKIVVLDRYYFSTIAYQGALGLSTKEIEEDNKRFAPEPDIVFLIDIDIDIATSRMSTRQKTKSVFEDKEYLLKVKAIYDKLDEPFIHRIDGSMSKKEVFIEIEEFMQDSILSYYD